MSPTCRCTWPTTQAGVGVRGGLLAGDRGRAGRRGRAARAAPSVLEAVGPLLARAVGGELDAVAVGVGEVDRLGDAVVGGALDRRARGGEARGGAGELLAASGTAARSGRGRRGGRRGARVGSSSRTSRSSPPAPSAATASVAAVQAQAERVLVEGDRAVEVGDGEVDGAEAQRVGEAVGRRGVGGGLRRGHGHRIARAAAAVRMAGPHRCMDFPRDARRGRPAAPRRGGA